MYTKDLFLKSVSDKRNVVTDITTLHTFSSQQTSVIWNQINRQEIAALNSASVMQIAIDTNYVEITVFTTSSVAHAFDTGGE